MFRFVLVITILISSLICNSQNNEQKLDSTFQLLSQTPESDFEKQIQLHLDVCRFSFRSSPDLVIEHGTIALDLSKSIGDRASEARALRRVGYAYENLGDKHYALTNFLEALSISRELGNQKVLATVLNEIGGIYLSYNELDKAESYFIKGLQIRQRINDQIGVMHSQGNLAAIYTNNKDYELALKYVDSYIAYADSTNNEDLKFIMIGNKAEIYSAMGNIDKASLLYSQSHQGSQRLNNIHGSLVVLRDFSIALLKAKRYHSCIEESNEGLSITENAFYKKEFSIILAKAYEAIGNVTKSHKYQSIYIHLSDSLYNVEKEADIARLEIVYKMKQKDSEIALKNRALSELEQRNYTNKLIGGLILLLVLLLSAFAYIINLRLKNHIKSMDMEIEDKDKVIAEIALKVINKDEIVDAVTNEKFRSGAIINKEELEEYILVNHNQFISNLSNQHPSLSKKEVRICSLIKLQLSSKEIGVMMNLSSRSVDTYRYNIRKKMNISSSDSLSKHIDQI